MFVVHRPQTTPKERLCRLYTLSMAHEREVLRWLVEGFNRLMWTSGLSHTLHFPRCTVISLYRVVGDHSPQRGHTHCSHPARIPSSYCANGWWWRRTEASIGNSRRTTATPNCRGIRSTQGRTSQKSVLR